MDRLEETKLGTTSSSSSNTGMKTITMTTTTTGGRELTEMEIKDKDELNEYKEMKKQQQEEGVVATNVTGDIGSAATFVSRA